jgi:hypothetical protein
LPSFRTTHGKRHPISPRSGRIYPSAGIKHEGSLTEEGYNLEESAETRQEALDKAVEKYGYAKTIEKLVALENVDVNRPEIHAKVHSDIRYLQKEHARAAHTQS